MARLELRLAGRSAQRPAHVSDTRGGAESSRSASSAGEINTALELIVELPILAERQRIGESGTRHRSRHPAPVMPATQDLVRDSGLRLLSRPQSERHVSPTTTWSPTSTISPLIVRALCVARSPHQHSART